MQSTTSWDSKNERAAVKMGSYRRASVAPGRELVEEAGEVEDVEGGRGGGVVAVGVGVTGGEAVEEAGEVEDVEDGGCGAGVAVGVAGGGAQFPGLVVECCGVAPEEDGLAAGRVVGHFMEPARRGAADQALGPCCSVPLPGFVAGSA